jgi:Raf kinase inhibitor-like YbhB/YbcL family protein
MGLRKIAAGVAALLFAAYFCTSAYGNAGKPGKIDLTSSAFREGDMIPQKYGFRDENVSPPLTWSAMPEGTKSIAVICDDPDAQGGVWVHWVIFNIPPDAEGLPEGVSREEVLRDGSVQGVNDFNKIGYDGPAPPYGVHRYVFKVFALDAMLDIQEGVTKKELLGAMSGHILGEGKLTGRSKKKIDIPAEPML